MKQLKWIVPLLLVCLIAVGSIYYFTELQPRLFIKSFLKEMEAHKYSSNLNDYMFSDYMIKPLLSWDDYFVEAKKDTYDFTIEQHFDIWQKVYLHSVYDYFELDPEHPNIYCSTTDFIKRYYDYNFSDFEVVNYTWLPDRTGIDAYGKVDAGIYNKSFRLISKKGQDGWKIIYFFVD